MKSEDKRFKNSWAWLKEDNDEVKKKKDEDKAEQEVDKKNDQEIKAEENIKYITGSRTARTNARITKE